MLALILEKAVRSRQLPLDQLVGHDIISLSHVDRHWRTVALGTPHLWSLVDVLPSKGSIYLAALFLQRSKQYPIDIYFLNGTIDTFVQIFLPHINRCREMSAFVASDVFWSEFSNIIREMATPQLQRLSICNATNAHRIAGDRRLAGLPRPFSPFILSGKDIEIPYTFTALTRFEIDAGPRINTIRDYMGLHSVLNGLPNLRDLILHETSYSVEFAYHTWMDQWPILHLPALCSLRYLSMHAESDIMYFLTKLDAPMLADVEIRYKFSTVAWDIASTTLRSVRRAILHFPVPMGHFWNTPWNWRNFDHLFPQLVDLTLPYNNFEQFIAYSLSDPTLLPWAHLETLTVADSPIDAQDLYGTDELFVPPWIAERIKQRVPIRKVKSLPKGAEYSDWALL